MPKRQYVNLDPTDVDQLKELPAKRAGRKITLKAKVDPAKAKVVVTFKIKHGAQNVEKKNDVIEKKVKTDSDGKATFELEVSKHGGDTYDVSAYLAGSEDAPLMTETYVVWRRLYYQMSRQAAGVLGANRKGSLPEIPALDVGPVEAEFVARGQNVELVDDTRNDVVARPHNIIDVGGDYPPTGRAGYVVAREPVMARIVLVNKIASSATATIERQIASDAALLALPHQTWCDETMDDNEDWLVSVDVRIGAGAWSSANKAAFSRAGRTSNYVNVDFGALNVGNATSVSLRITYRYEASSCAGSTFSNLACIETNTNVGNLQQTVIHELGHMIGMVPTKQATHYVEKGHTGPHCYAGIEAQKKMKSYVGLPGSCVMFGEGNNSRAATFCDACTPSLRRCKVNVPRRLW